MKGWVFGLGFIFALGCGSKAPVIRATAPAQFEQAKKQFDAKKYGKAAEGFKRVIFEHPGSDFVDDAQYYLAESYFLMKDYGQAREEYKFLLDNLPQSPYRQEAFFKLGVCHYESARSYHHSQTETVEALEIFREFALRFPHSELLAQAEAYRRSCLEKLAKKQLETGRLYLRLGRYSSAEVYLEDGIESFPESKHKREFYFLLGECYEKEGRTDKAVEAYREIARGDGKFARAARKRLLNLEEGK